MCSDDALAQILSIVISGLRAWTRAARLEQFGDQLDACVAAGWLARWLEDGTGRRLALGSYTLTPWAASALGVRLEETITPTGLGLPYWLPVAADEDECAVHRARRQRQPLGMPRKVPLRRPRPRVLCDEDGRPILICGREIMIDPRLARARWPARKKNAGDAHPRRKRSPGRREAHVPSRAVSI